MLVILGVHKSAIYLIQNPHYVYTRYSLLKRSDTSDKPPVVNDKEWRNVVLA